MLSDHDQSNELSMLDGDDGSVSPNYLEDLTVQLEYFDCSHTSRVQSSYNHFHILLYKI